MKDKICSICKINKPFTEFYKRKDAKDGMQNHCKKCRYNAYVKYMGTEKNFMSELYLGLWSRFRRIKKRKDLTKEEKKQHEIKITKPQFLKLWEEHKKKYGLKCCMTQTDFTFQRGNRRKTSNKNNHNVSVDRLDNSKGYTANNIVFVTFAFNDRKCSIMILDCVNILRHYKERFPDTHTCKLIELYEKIGNLQSREKYKNKLNDLPKKGMLN
jgi:hypothetical protein